MRRKSGIKCDKCGYTEYGSAMIVFQYYKKPCPECGAPIITKVDVAKWIYINFLIMIFTPINYIAVKFFGGKEAEHKLTVKGDKVECKIKED